MSKTSCLGVNINNSNTNNNNNHSGENFNQLYQSRLKTANLNASSTNSTAKAFLSIFNNTNNNNSKKNNINISIQDNRSINNSNINKKLNISTNCRPDVVINETGIKKVDNTTTTTTTLSSSSHFNHKIELNSSGSGEDRSLLNFYFDNENYAHHSEIYHQLKTNTTTTTQASIDNSLKLLTDSSSSDSKQKFSQNNSLSRSSYYNNYETEAKQQQPQKVVEDLNSNLDCLVDQITDFDDLQRASVILRKALVEINKKQLTNSTVVTKAQFSQFSPTCSAHSPVLSSPTHTVNNNSSSANFDSSVNLSLNVSSSSSSNNSSCIYQSEINQAEFLSCFEGAVVASEDLEQHQPLAFDNLTYSSSVEDLAEKNESPDSLSDLVSFGAQSGSDFLKKRLKFIKRKDKLKKNSIVSGIPMEDLIR
jgi:hypothetical protein